LTNLNDVVTANVDHAVSDSTAAGNKRRAALTVGRAQTSGNPPGGQTSPPAYIADVGNAQEGPRSRTAGGPRRIRGRPGLVMNIVPKTGGKLALWRPSSSPARARSSRATNFTDAFARSRSSNAAAADEKCTTFNGSFGGTVQERDKRVVFFVNARDAGQHARAIAKHLGKTPTSAIPTKWLYVPNLSKPAVRPTKTGEKREHPDHVAGSHRGTKVERLLGRAGQLPQVHRPDKPASPIRRAWAPEARGVAQTLPLRVPQLDVGPRPRTSRLLLDAGFGGRLLRLGQLRAQTPTRRAISDRHGRAVRAELARNKRQTFRASSTGRRTFGTNTAALVQTGRHQSSYGHRRETASRSATRAR